MVCVGDDRTWMNLILPCRLHVVVSILILQAPFEVAPLDMLHGIPCIIRVSVFLVLLHVKSALGLVGAKRCATSAGRIRKAERGELVYRAELSRPQQRTEHDILLIERSEAPDLLERLAITTRAAIVESSPSSLRRP